jgi:gliding motility-associated-like protein
LKYLVQQLLVLTSFLIIYHTSKAQVADFAAQQTEGCAPIGVQFINNSIGSYNYIAWDFNGDGTFPIQGDPDTIPDPFWTYQFPGTYTVSLVVSDGFLSDTLTRVAYITAFQNPTTIFEGNPQTECGPTQVSFSDLSVPGDGAITNWLWGFGDGTTSNEQNPTHSYLPGTYNVSLFVVDENGCEANAIFPQYIDIEDGVDPSFIMTPSSSCNAVQEVTFENNSVGVGTLEYFWDFGNGETSTEANPPPVTYTQFGTYTITLTVGNDNCTRITTQEFIMMENPTVSFTFEPACQGLSTQFTNTSSSVYTNFVWQFGDGSESLEESPEHVFVDPGSYPVTLIATDPSGFCPQNQTTAFVTIPSAEDIEIIIESHRVCQLPFAIPVEIQAEGIEFVEWEVNSTAGNTIAEGSGNPFIVDFQEGLFDGNYTLSGTVYFETGCVLNFTDPTPFEVVTPIIDAFIEPVNGCLPVTVNFASTSSHIYGIDSVSWDVEYVGDGVEDPDYIVDQPGFTFTHEFTLRGFYFVYLTVYTSDGCDPRKLVSVLKFGNHTFPDFEYPEDTVCVDTEPLQFTYIGTPAWDDLTSHIWFGPGWTEPIIENPFYPITADPDTGYMVMLVTEDFGCYDTMEVFIDSLIGLGPKAKIQPIPPRLCRYDDPYEVVVTNNSIATDPYENTQWQWFVSNGITSTNDTLDTLVFETPGEYIVALTAWDPVITQCTSFTFVPIIIDGFNIDTLVPPGDTLLCFGELFQTNPLSSNQVTYDPTIVEYTWSMGDGSDTIFSLGDTGTVYHYFNQPGVFDLTVIGNWGGCYDTLIQPITVAQNPVADFFLPDIQNCPPFTLELNDSSTVGDAPISEWEWEYINVNLVPPVGTIFGGPDTSLEIIDPELYLFQLVVVDEYGCSDTSEIKVLENNVDAFEVPDQTTCNDNLYAVQYEFEGLYPPFTYNWVFNGTIESDTGLVQIEGVEQDSIVQGEVYITDAIGCEYYTNFEIFVSVPQLSFEARFDTVNCNPTLAVSFEFDISSTAPGVEEYGIDFSDGQSFLTTNPEGAQGIVYFFNTPGEIVVDYYVKADGCFTQKQTTIEIPGSSYGFTYSTEDICPPFEVVFELVGDTTGIGEFSWDFGDGSAPTFNEAPTAHTYTLAGAFVPLLVYNSDVTDELNCQIANPGDSIIIDGPLLAISTDFDTTCAGSAVNIYNESINGTEFEAIEWTWDFGDGSDVEVQQTSIPQDPTPHVYNNEGYQIVTLTAVTEEGCTYVLEDSLLFVVQGLPLVAEADYEPGCVPLTVFFNPDENGTNLPLIENPFWSFGDDSTSSDLLPTHTYTQEGTSFFPVFAYSYLGCDFTVELDEIRPEDFPIADFIATPNLEGTAVNSYDLADQSIGAEQISWFADGVFFSNNTTETLEVSEDPTEVMLIAVNEFGCEDTTLKILEGILVEPINIISPNNDGLNDNLEFHNPDKEFCLKLQIYNRWGTLIYEDDAYRNDWNGINRNGEEVSEGVYFWVLNVCDETTLTGYVHVVR